MSFTEDRRIDDRQSGIIQSLCYGMILVLPFDGIFSETKRQNNMRKLEQ